MMHVRAAGRMVLLALAGTLVFAAVPAGAEAAATFALKPSADAVKRGYFLKEARPGARIGDDVQVVNVGDRAGRVRLFAVDATTGQTSGAVYGSATARRRGVGAWIHLATRVLTLGPGQSRAVAFSIVVPRGAPDGENLGGLVAAPVLPVAQRSGRRGRGAFRINVREQAIVAVQVNLPGPRREALAITGARAAGTHGFPAVAVGLANGGNTLLKGHGTLTVTDRGGHLRKRAAYALDTFVPGTRIAFPVYLRGRPLSPGRYVAHVAIRYGRGHTATRTIAFTVSRAQAQRVVAAAVRPSGGKRGGGPSVVLLALGAIGLVLLGAAGSALLVRRRLRTASPGQR